MKAAEIEIAVAEYFGIRQHLIVPNVSWGFGFSHEIDMLIVTGSGYASEIEIKVSKSDLKRDRKKRKWKTGMYSEFGDIYQTHNTIKSLYFAIPKEEDLEPETKTFGEMKWPILSNASSRERRKCRTA